MRNQTAKQKCKIASYDLLNIKRKGGNVKMLKEKGITLVALVVTIIIMLILAGVALNMALGDNGLISQAKKATQKYENAQQKEEESLKDLADDLQTQLRNAGEETVKPHDANWDTDKVTPTSDGKGNVIPVPKGFYYAGGTKSTGFVISDVSGDDLNNSKHGNQFVWIPCTVDEYKDAKDDVMDEKWSSNSQYKDNGDDDWTGAEGGGSGTDWSDNYTEADNTFINGTYKDESEAATLPTNSWEKNQTTVATTSINKYGGFYIARFEAGVPSDASFYSTNETYNTARGSKADTTAIQSYKPISKKGVQAWNYITQPNSKMIAENMYKDGANGTGESVGSYLVDSQAWNRICHVFDSILGTSEEKETAGKTITNSTAWGNYYNNSTTDYSKVTGLWAKHGGTKTGWVAATKYETAQLTNKDRTDQAAGYYSYIELPTGSSDDFRVYNIYDMAGNMWEWTTGHNIKVTDTTNKTEQMFVVPRGGGFNHTGSVNPVVRAHGNNELTYYNFDGGFRVVLYVK